MSDEPDLSDIPEADEAWFRMARVSLAEKFVCTPERPWTPDVGGHGILVLHPAAVPVDELEVQRRCPVCGYEWRWELPEQPR